MEDLIAAIWHANDQEISSHGYRAFPVNGKYAVLYASPDDMGHTPGSGVRLDITYVGMYSHLTAAAAAICDEIAKDGR